MSPIRSAVFLGAICLGAIATYDGDARASWVRIQAAGCYNATVSSQLQDNSYGIMNVSGWGGDLPEICPAPDTQLVPKSTFKMVNVEGWATWGPFHAMVCYGNAYGEYGGCSPNVSSGGVTGGHQTAILGSYAPSYWGTSDPGYVWVGVNPMSRIAGIYLAQ